MKLCSLAVLFILTFPAGLALGQQLVTIPMPGVTAQIQADLYGGGARAIVLAHGGRLGKESWKKQAEVLTNHGFRVLALRFRGDGSNPDGSPGSFGSDAENATDVLASVSYLRRTGAQTISAVGASLGGDAVGQASAESPPGTFDRIVLLASSGGDAPERLTGRKLFIFARSDKNDAGFRLDEISRHYAKAPQPKKMVILSGSAHAQFLFDTDQGPRLLREILRFLSEP